MATFSANPSRFDPYKNFKFRVKWDGRYVAGVTEVPALKGSTESGDQPARGKRSAARKVPGLRKFGAVTLKRGITQDRGFESWARRAQAGSDPSAKNSLKNIRRDIIVEVYDEAGQLALAYKLDGCWVSDLQAVPDLSVEANAVAIESITLENEGWEQIDS